MRKDSHRSQQEQYRRQKNFKVITIITLYYGLRRGEDNQETKTDTLTASIHADILSLVFDGLNVLGAMSRLWVGFG